VSAHSQVRWTLAAAPDAHRALHKLSPSSGPASATDWNNSLSGQGDFHED
jgi:hypothetical protein